VLPEHCFQTDDDDDDDDDDPLGFIIDGVAYCANAYGMPERVELASICDLSKVVQWLKGDCP
jgi:hypothetical protein